MSATRLPPMPLGAPSGPHSIEGETSRGNIHQRITETPAAFMSAMTSENAPGSVETPGPHPPPKSPAKLFQAQLVPYMNRFSHCQVTPATGAGQASLQVPEVRTATVAVSDRVASSSLVAA